MCAVLFIAPAARAQTVRDDLWIADGTVNATAVSGNTLYLGGSFTRVGPSTGAGVPIDSVTALAVSPFPKVTGQVLAVASDGAGGWYLGGAFSAVGGVARSNLAHVKADATLDSWDPSANSTVRSLVVSGGIVYAGGDFTTAAGQPRSRLVAIDAVTGAASAWNPGANAIVRVLALDGATLYVVGDFTTLAGQARSRIGAVDAATGAATAWNPGANNAVRALALDAGVVYVGGDFTVAGGQARTRIAAIDAGTGAATAWNPGANGQVAALAVGPGVVYAGGVFSTTGGQTRNRIAAIDAASGLATGWNPNANNQVLALRVSGNLVYAGGDFGNIGGQTRARLAALDAATGAATAWNPGVFGTVNALATDPGRVFAGGNFPGMGGLARANLAALDIPSGAATAWDPGANGPALAIVLRGARVYVGGSYTSIGGSTRTNLAAIDSVTGTATAWAPDPDGSVFALAFNGAALIAGGDFITIGGQPHNRLASVDITTGAAAAWNPDLDGTVFALTIGDNVVYAGGAFATVDGVARNMAGAVNATTGAVTAWDPNANGTVRALVASCGTVYVGGFFTTIGGQARNRVAALDPITGAAAAFNPNANGPVFSLALGGGALYVGGVIGTVGGQARNRVAAIDPATGLATPWNPNANNVVRTFTVNGAVYAGGSFTTMGPFPASGIASITADASLSCPAIVVSPDTLVDGRVGTAYAQSLSATGAAGPFCWSVSAGALPAGLSLDPPSGQLAGTPGASGTFAFTVTAMLANGCRGTRAYSLRVRPACAAMSITPTQLPFARAGEPYNQALAATAGAAPFTFALIAGTLPAGLALSGAGVVSGTPSAAGTSVFTVQVTDANACTGSAACTLLVRPACTPLTVRPADLPDGWVGGAYAQSLTTAAGTAPFTWSVRSGTLPAGLTLSPGGALSGTPTAPGSYVFVVGVTDANGCADSLSHVVAVFADAPVSEVAPAPTGCITDSQPCVAVPFTLVRGESTAVGATSVSFQIDTSKVVLCTPAHPDSSIHVGALYAGFNVVLQVIDQGGGAYTVDEVILGQPCGIPGGGPLFTVDLAAAHGNGAGAIAVSAVHARDCANVSVPVKPGAPATITIDHGAPVGISNLSATQVRAGNAPGQTTGISLAWSTGGAGTVSVYRAPFGAYPEYDDDGPLAPPDSAAAPGAPWVLVSADAHSGHVDHPPARGVWHYVAIVTDGCGQPSIVSNETAGTLDYHLGDVSDGATAGTGNNTVAGEDISLLGAHYGIGDSAITARGVAYLDVGPTLDATPLTRPHPDDVLDFEDLMIMAANYHAVSAPALAAAPAAAATDAFELAAPSLVRAGEEVTAVLRVHGSGQMQGFSAALDWDPAVLAPLAVRSLRFVEAQGGVVLSPRPGAVDAALLGIRSTGIAGDGDVAELTFRVLKDGDPALRLERLDARDAHNRPLGPGRVATGKTTPAPALTTLFAPGANPIHGATQFGFSLAAPGEAELAVFGVDGRRVRTLAAGARPAGVYHVPWDGRDDHGHPVAAGVFYLRFAAAHTRMTRTLVVLK